MISYYVHNIDPIIFSISDAIKLRWYGLSYLLAFVAGYLILKKLADKSLWVLPGEKVSDFITMSAVFGVFLGGRIGSVLVYQWDDFLVNPLMIVKVWEGGMASHGGILGLTIFTIVYSRMNKVSWAGLSDGLCVVGPLGVMFGRLANFINGELYGRIDRAHAWAMKFPDALTDDMRSKENVLENQQLLFRDIDAINPALARTINPDIYVAEKIHYGHFSEASLNSEAIRDAITPYLEPRYPSQLFQAMGEGLSVFLILLIMRIKFPKLPHGVITGTFFVIYAIFRIAVENYREPETADIQLLGLGFTMGQFLSLFMIVMGAAVITISLIKHKGAKHA